MELIDKSAVVAEIRKHQAVWDGMDGDYCKGQRLAYSDMLSFLDTLEVEEVDLEKEIDREIETRWHGEYLFITKFKESAKHFFELGIYSKLSWQDMRRIAEIGEEFMNSEESDNLSEEEYYIRILDKFKVQKGK